MPKPAITIHQAPHRRQPAETEMRYEVRLHGAYDSELSYNTRGYSGTLPTVKGARFDPGEVSISGFRRAAAMLNREWNKGLKPGAHVPAPVQG